jgi:hypothetical protein
VNYARIPQADDLIGDRNAFQAKISAAFDKLLNDIGGPDLIDDWYAVHAGYSLVACRATGTQNAACVELPSAQAARLADTCPDQYLIVATWSRL